jgi:hypothetical protein
MHFDLRKYDASAEVDRVATALGVRFDMDTEVRKRRSIGILADNGAWIRIEQQPLTRFIERGNNGLESSAAITDVAKPAWHRSVSWIDRQDSRMWRADEIEYVTSPHVIPWGTLREYPNLPDEWWVTLSTSLDALACHKTRRVAMTQERVTEVVESLFPGVDTHIDEWATAHGDLYWPNLTAPECWLLDWEDWGTAPRGFDAACLWHDSLLVPKLADRVYSERRADLESRSGLLCQLMRCAYSISAPAGYADEFVEPAKTEARRVIDQLTKLA